jgi:crotonobetainyl-CoA:carnitine CoA-transferase CaiB-like acyl-CoA transferase
MSALNGVRIVELAESVAGEYCGKLLADFGAEVIKVEMPGSGSPTRAMTPGSVFAYLNTNKRSVVLDVPREQDALDDLVGSADAVIGEQGLSELAARHQGVVFCAITPYGQGAPPEMQNAKSINVFHSSGWGYHTPSHADPALPPLKGPGRFLPDYEAGLDAALCVAWSPNCTPAEANSSMFRPRRCWCRVPTAYWAGSSRARSLPRTAAPTTTSRGPPRYSRAATGMCICT